jgi:ABC-type cobalamin transport system ATPase subunit
VIAAQRAQGRAFVISSHDLNWILKLHNTQTWVLFQNTMFLKGPTSHILNDIKLGEVFKIKTNLIHVNDKSLISFSSLDEL